MDVALSPDGRLMAYAWMLADRSFELRVADIDDTWPRAQANVGEPPVIAIRGQPDRPRSSADHSYCPRKERPSIASMSGTSPTACFHLGLGILAVERQRQFREGSEHGIQVEILMSGYRRSRSRERV